MRTGRAGVLVLAAVLVACQPFGGPRSVTPTQGVARPGGPALGAPEAGMPATLDELLTRATRIAEEWQDEPVPVEIEVDLDADHRWRAARVVYLAADADRFLEVETSGAGFSQQLPTLSTLQVPPVTADGVTAIPPFPGDVAAPAELAQGPAVEECAIPAPRAVLYVTGAPVAWDGSAWTAPPAWTATVTSGDAAATVDPRSGATVRCLE